MGAKNPRLHPPDELDHFLVLFRPPKSASGFQSPKHPEAISLPADECFRLEDDQRVSPIGPNPHQEKPKISVGPAETGPACLPFEHHELMARRQDFEGEIVPASEERKRVCQNDPESGQHNSPSLIANPRLLIISRPDGLSATHRSSKSAFRPNPARFASYCLNRSLSRTPLAQPVHFHKAEAGAKGTRKAC